MESLKVCSIDNYLQITGKKRINHLTEESEFALTVKKPQEFNIER